MYQVSSNMEDLIPIASIGLVIGLISALISRYFAKRRFFQLAEKLPGPKGLPLLGNAFEFMGTPHTVFTNLLVQVERLKGHDVLKFWAGSRLFVALTHPSDIELLLSSNEYLEKSLEYGDFAPWFGTHGLLISNGQKWKAHRKLIAPTFHINVLRSFMDKFNRNARDVVERLKSENGKEFDAHDYMSEATVETLIETVMGVNKDVVNTNSEKKIVRNCLDYAHDVMRLCEIVFGKQTKLWIKPSLLFSISGYKKEHDRLLSRIHGLTNKVMAKKLEDVNSMSSVTKTTFTSQENLSFESNKGFSFGQSAGLKDDLDFDDYGNKRRVPFLESLIEQSILGNGITQSEVKNQLDTIMFEGHDTTAAGSSFFLCLLGLHQDIQDKVIKEVDGIFKGSDRDITFHDTIEMKYLERCIMETLRLYPPVPSISRELRKELKMASCDLILPANCTVSIPIFVLHRREDIFPNPHVFNPDNFLPEKAASRHFYSFIPFSAGPRSCVGRKYAMLKLKVILANIMRNFRVTSDIAESDWKLQPDIILKRTDGFKVKLTRRKPVVS